MDTSSKKVILAALVGNTLVAITKFVAASITGSSAMISEAIHSVVDTGNQVLLLYGLKRAQKPADADFPFGHGKEIYFWSFVVAILIFAVGAGLSIYEGIHSLYNPKPIENAYVNYIVLVLAMLFEGAAWYFAFKEFTKTKGKWGYIDAVKHGKDPSLFMVLFEDSAAMLGLVIAFIGILLGQITGNPMYDGIASILIGCILAGTAIWLAYETKGLLIGESAKPEIVEAIHKQAKTHGIVDKVNEILTMHMGPDFILVNLSLDFSDTATAGNVEKTISDIDKHLKKQFPEIKRIFIEAEASTKA
jgi:cation diffusion facilitator family transporter